MKLHWIGKLYGCFLYETIIQIALWFIVTFITLVFLGDNHSINPSILGFILWCSSGLYFIYSWANGETYDGQWKNGSKNGYGIWDGLNCDKYMGEWKDNKFHGQGIYTHPNGTVEDGEWKEDEFIKKNEKN